MKPKIIDLSKDDFKDITIRKTKQGVSIWFGQLWILDASLIKESGKMSFSVMEDDGRGYFVEDKKCYLRPNSRTFILKKLKQ